MWSAKQQQQHQAVHLEARCKTWSLCIKPGLTEALYKTWPVLYCPVMEPTQGTLKSGQIKSEYFWLEPENFIMLRV